jgi:hypothetical protein
VQRLVDEGRRALIDVVGHRATVRLHVGSACCANAVPVNEPIANARARNVREY